MTKNEALRQARLTNTLKNLGFSENEAIALRQISGTLRRWFAHECNGAIQRDGEAGDGRPYWLTESGRRYSAPDRERDALKRLAAIMARHAPLASYVQGDPRGCALYILRPGDVPEGARADSHYSRGIAVY